jgi:hypothetical protein
MAIDSGTSRADESVVTERTEKTKVSWKWIYAALRIGLPVKPLAKLVNLPLLARKPVPIPSTFGSTRIVSKYFSCVNLTRVTTSGRGNCDSPLSFFLPRDSGPIYVRYGTSATRSAVTVRAASLRHFQTPQRPEDLGWQKCGCAAHGRLLRHKQRPEPPVRSMSPRTFLDHADAGHAREPEEL